MRRDRSEAQASKPPFLSKAVRWCLAAVVSAIAGIISLATSAVADNFYPFHYCDQNAKAPCTSCKNPPVTGSSACSPYSAWPWGLCMPTDSTIHCTQAGYSCGILLDCKSNTEIAACPGGQFTKCEQLR